MLDSRSLIIDARLPVTEVRFEYRVSSIEHLMSFADYHLIDFEPAYRANQIKKIFRITVAN
jgi:hypothetical protein